MTEIQAFIEWVITLVSDNLYPGVFLAALIETVFPPIPSEAVFPLAGYIVLKNEMSIIHIFGVGITGGSGATLGAFIIYVIALKLGRTGLAKYMKYAKINPEKLTKADKWFEKYGDKAVFVGRMIPVMREMISVPAGLLGMKIPKFVLYTFAGSLVWATGTILAGYYFGESWGLFT